jgi:hypothetical protein
MPRASPEPTSVKAAMSSRIWGRERALRRCDEIRAELGDPAFTVDDDTLIVAERFRLLP